MVLLSGSFIHSKSEKGWLFYLYYLYYRNNNIYHDYERKPCAFNSLLHQLMFLCIERECSYLAGSSILYYSIHLPRHWLSNTTILGRQAVSMARVVLN